MEHRSSCARTAMSVRCTSCGNITPAGQLGEVGSEWEGQWFCGSCWHEWDLRESANVHGTGEEDKWFSDWRSCSTADEFDEVEDGLWGTEDRDADDAASEVSEGAYSGAGSVDGTLEWAECCHGDGLNAPCRAAYRASSRASTASSDDLTVVQRETSRRDEPAEGPGAASGLGDCAIDGTGESCTEEEAAEGEEGGPLRDACEPAGGAVGLPELLQRLPVAHAFWQHAEPLQGLNAQRSQALHRLSTVSKRLARAASDACASLSDPELVFEVVQRWRRYEIQVVLAMQSFNRRQAACRSIGDPLPLVPFDSGSEEEDDY